jgi:hypothetical protein
LNHVRAADLSDLARNAFRVRPGAGSGGENPAPRFAGRRIDQKFIPAKVHPSKSSSQQSLILLI